VPGELYYHPENDPVSLGLVDDTSDGIVECQLRGSKFRAVARIVVSPPHFAPDRRNFISIADGLTDRMDRESVERSSYYSRTSKKHPGLTLADVEIRDLMERVYETMGTMNLEVLRDRIDFENEQVAFDHDIPWNEDSHFAFAPVPSSKEWRFPLTEIARERHRRLALLEVFKRLILQNPNVIQEWIRPPACDEVLFNRRMPVLMRGSGDRPLHLTRRQYTMLQNWARRLVDKARNT
jgi:hypothetical protein